MSLDKAIESGKEHRKQYRGAKLVDCSCRNHGNHGHGPGTQCSYCLENRLHSTKVRESVAEAAREILTDSDYCEGCFDANCQQCPFHPDNT